jgi:tetratricopeptide (TPR) repeat protein
MIFYEIVEGKYPLPAKTIAAATTKRPPFTVIKNELHKQLLRNTWDPDPEKRLTFAAIVKLLEQESYWMPETDPEAFRTYKAYLDAEADRIATERFASQAPWMSILRTNGELDNLQFHSILQGSHLGDFAAQVTEAVLHLNGHIGPPSLFSATRLLRDNLQLAWVKTLVEGLAQGTPLQAGAIAEVSGNLTEASRQYKKAALEGDRQAITRYAVLLISHKHEKEGLALLEALAKTGDLQANYTLADYYYRWKEDHGKALEYFKKCTQDAEEGRFGHALLIVADILAEQGNFVEAARYARLAKDRGQNDPLFHRASAKLNEYTKKRK